MISPISSSSALLQSASPAVQAKRQQASSSEAQDTVQLSAKAQAHASGDVDHDGDSH
jgi:hypothetical protein